MYEDFSFQFKRGAGAFPSRTLRRLFMLLIHARPDLLFTVCWPLFWDKLPIRGRRSFFTRKPLVGLALLNPVRTVSAQMSMHGKGFTSGSGTFNRLTTIELLVSPHYLVYYTGSRLGELAQRIKSGQSVYHTYLGSAYCLTFPTYQGLYQAAKVVPNGKPLNLSTVIPQEAVQEVAFEPGDNYAVARALPYRHIGGRIFEQTINVLYETNGRPLRIIAEQNRKINCKFAAIPGGKVICLW